MRINQTEMCGRSLCNISEGWDEIAVLVNGVNPGDGGSSVGGISFTLEPVDLAKVFVQVMENIKPIGATVYCVQVQKSILENTSGVNCSCGAELLSESRISDTTVAIIGPHSPLLR